MLPDRPGALIICWPVHRGTIGLDNGPVVERRCAMCRLPVWWRPDVDATEHAFTLAICVDCAIEHGPPAVRASCAAVLAGLLARLN